MKKFIGVKMIEAEKMSLSEFNMKFKGMPPMEAGKVDGEGYHVRYEDGYDSWSPKEVFEKAYYGLADEEGKKITVEDVKSFTPSVTVAKLGDKTTMVFSRTITGFEMVDTSSCVDPENYDVALGVKYAQENLMEKLWAHLGFVLQWAKNGLSYENKDTEIALLGD